MWAAVRSGVLVSLSILGYLAAHILLVDMDGRGSALVAEPAVIDRAAGNAADVSVLFLGDTGQTEASEPLLSERGYRWALGATAELVQGADLAVANLEIPISDGGDAFPLWKGYQYRTPPAWADALGWAGIDVATLANNHALDEGPRGLADTRRLLAQQGIASAGAGATIDEARRGVVARIGGVRVGILAYCERQFAFTVYERLFAGHSRAGVAPLSAVALAEDIGRLRPLVDVLFVTVHWGDNYAPPRAAVGRWAATAIDLGADAVIGHHPHVAHPVGSHRGRPILLSLGNYSFGTPGHPVLDHGLMAFAHIVDKRLDRIELEPIDVQNRRVAFRPVPLQGERRDAVLAELVEGSRRRGTRLHIAGGRAIVPGRGDAP